MTKQIQPYTQFFTCYSCVFVFLVTDNVSLLKTKYKIIRKLTRVYVVEMYFLRRMTKRILL